MTKRTSVAERQQDEELAAYTDALLDGEPLAEGQARPVEADTVETLARVLGHREPPARLRQRIRRQVAAAWPEHRASMREGLRRWLKTLTLARNRWAWAAASILVALFCAASLIVPTGVQQVVGTAGDLDPVTLVAAVTAVVVMVAVLIWINSRRR